MAAANLEQPDDGFEESNRLRAFGTSAWQARWHKSADTVFYYYSI